MKSKLNILLVLLFGYSIAFADTNADADQQKNGEALATLTAVNKNEIAAGNLAEKKGKNSDVKDFAKLMIKDHGNNLEQTKAVSKKTGIKPVETADVKDLKAQGKKDLQSLKDSKAGDFDKNYMDAMVKGHQDVSGKLDTLQQAVTNSDVKNFLTETKAHVDAHLAKAKEIQDKLSKS